MQERLNDDTRPGLGGGGTGISGTEDIVLSTRDCTPTGPARQFPAHWAELRQAAHAARLAGDTQGFERLRRDLLQDQARWLAALEGTRS